MKEEARDQKQCYGPDRGDDARDQVDGVRAKAGEYDGSLRGVEPRGADGETVCRVIRPDLLEQEAHSRDVEVPRPLPPHPVLYGCCYRSHEHQPEKEVSDV